MPSAARRALGLDSVGASLISAPRSSPDLETAYPDTPIDAVRNVSRLWLADLGDATTVQRGRADPRAWNDASLRWLVDPGRVPEESACGARIGMFDIERFRTTVDMFDKLDDRAACMRQVVCLAGWLVLLVSTTSLLADSHVSPGHMITPGAGAMAVLQSIFKTRGKPLEDVSAAEDAKLNDQESKLKP